MIVKPEANELLGSIIVYEDKLLCMRLSKYIPFEKLYNDYTIYELHEFNVINVAIEYEPLQEEK